MEQLISMRQRIKSVQTIQKITQAMRLISISTHSRLNNKKLNLEKYKESLFELYLTIQANLESETSLSTAHQSAHNKNLIILVSSQKGLSGVFNTNLFKFFEKNYILQAEDQFITIGKIASDYLKKLQNQIPLVSFDTFNSTNFSDIAHEITGLILQNSSNYQSILLFANHPKSFFIQEPSKITLLPFQKINSSISKEDIKSKIDYKISEPKKLITSLEKIILTTLVQNSLFNSLLAEQAARFLSMDTATRNAENLISEMQINYNKLRQASITKELTEMTAGLSS